MRLDPLLKQYDEIKKLYELSESDIICLTQMAMMIQILGFSPKLAVKLLKALSAMWEMTLEHQSKEN